MSTSTTIVNGTTYYASQTVTGCESPTRLAVAVTVGVMPAPTGSATQPFCSASTITNLTATGSSIQWYSSPTGGSALSGSTVLVNGTTYYASQTVSGCESPTRLAVTVTIGTTQAPTGSTAQSFCSTSTIANLTATGSSIQWYSSPTGGSVLSTSTQLVNGSIYYASQTVSGCESSARLAVTVTIGATQAPSGLTAQSFCSASTIANLNATGSSIQWYASASGGSALVSSTPLVNGTTYYASQTVSGCESTIRLAVNITINIVQAPTGGSIQSFCSSATVANLSATGTSIQWYLTPSGGTPLVTSTALINNILYYASQSTGGCVSSNRLTVAVVVHPNPTVTIASLPILCTNSTPLTLTQGSPTGGVYSGSGVTGGIFNPASVTVGTYQITYTYTDNNQCTGSSQNSIVVSNCAGMSELNENSFLIYPNPANESIVISSNSDLIKSVQLFDNTGRLVVAQETAEFVSSIQLDVSNYEQGVYTVRINSGSNRVIQKIVINK